MARQRVWWEIDKPNFLVIVDMQPVFGSSQDKTLIKSIRDQIRLAKRRNMVILIVEYVGMACDEQDRTARTDYRIIAAIGNYVNVYFLKKTTNNGGPPIHDLLKRLFAVEQYRQSTFQVVGVNTTACVLSTVEGLSKRFPQAKIQVPIECCRDNRSEIYSLQRLQELMPENAIVI